MFDVTCLLQVQGHSDLHILGSAVDEGRHGAASTLSARPYSVLEAGWVWAERLGATGRHLLGFSQLARRGLLAAAPAAAAAAAPAAAPASAPAAAPAAANGGQAPCQAIAAAAAAGTALNYTSVEAFCLAQVAAWACGAASASLSLCCDSHTDGIGAPGTWNYQRSQRRPQLSTVRPSRLPAWRRAPGL